MADFPKKYSKKPSFSKSSGNKSWPKKGDKHKNASNQPQRRTPGSKEVYTPPVDFHNTYLIYGRHPSIQALSNPERKVKKIVCSQNGYNFIEEKLPAERLSKIPHEIVDIRKLDSMLPPDSNHQGVILIADPLVQPTIETVLDAELVVLLDQITDPHNVGAIIRSAAAFGASAVITTERASPPENATIIKTAAGTFESTPYIRGGNLNDAILKLKDEGFRVIGLDGEAEHDINDARSKAPKVALVVGAEGKGMRQLVKENCDIVAKIDISSAVESLNASVAAAVALFALKNRG